MKKVLFIPVVILVVAVAMLAGRVAVAHATPVCSMSPHAAPVIGTPGSFSTDIGWTSPNFYGGSCSGVGGTWKIQNTLQYRVGAGAWVNATCAGSACQVTQGNYADGASSGNLGAVFTESDYYAANGGNPPCKVDWRGFIRFQFSGGGLINTDHTDILSATC